MPATASEPSRLRNKTKPYERHEGIPWLVLPHPVMNGRKYLPPAPHAVPAKYVLQFPEEIQACDHLTGFDQFKTHKPEVKVGVILADVISVTGLPIVQSPIEHTGSSSTRMPTPPVKNIFWKRRGSDGSFIPSEGLGGNNRVSAQLFPSGKAAGYSWITPARSPSPDIKVEEGVAAGEDSRVKMEVMGSEEAMDVYRGQEVVKMEELDVEIKQELMDD